MSERPVLSTARFDLWRPRASDLPDLVDLMADEETRRFLGPNRAGAPAVFERLQRNAGSWALHGYGTFHVRAHGNDAIIATCGVFHSWRGFGKGMDDVPEAGWIVRHDRCGHGIACEVMDAALAWFNHTHGPRRIACMIEHGNTASARLAARLGFVAYDEHCTDEDVHITLLERGAC
ncbi:GNAT family N-acetyltransferase [Novosphingobium sp. Leaf2]|uniref:GNAT family N-acetyltransferase n=1 Tax=Novosphingobium sp. Leaf2 TaxID=1735670 RepID=UPI0006FFD909|nr:GNAT family N-acetyltransferase [Novosphingobium sp. Leaf2]KQM21881.1 GCN5 family acetyltransferase [Novosphingobium sp. Leaf2]